MSLSVHPALRLTTSTCRTERAVSAGEVVLRAPAVGGGPPAADVLLSAGETLKTVLAAVELRFEQTLGNGGLISKPVVVRAVSLMYELANPEPAADAWPSAAQLRSLPLLWDDAELEQLQGTHAGELIESLRAEVSLICDVVVVPSIAVAQTDFFTAAEATLDESFIRAVALLRSRCLPSNEASISPILHLVHTVPTDTIEANVRLEHAALQTGGDAIVTTRALMPDEQLTLYVGPMSSAQYFCRFGCLPRRAPTEGDLRNPLDRISVRLSPRILRLAGSEEGEEGDMGDISQADVGPTSPSVELRQRVLSVVGFQGDVADIGAFELSAAELDVYRCANALSLYHCSLPASRCHHHSITGNTTTSTNAGRARRAQQRSANCARCSYCSRWQATSSSRGSKWVLSSGTSILRA